MAVSGKTKKELIEEISALKSRLKQLEHNEVRLRQTTKKTQDVPVEEGICVSDINIEWKPDKGLCTFEKLPVVMMWINSTLASLMSGVQAMVGTERFGLALQSEGRKSVEDDWQVISQFPDFNEGFEAICQPFLRQESQGLCRALLIGSGGVEKILFEQRYVDI